MIIDIAHEYLPNLRKKTAHEWCGPCPECGGDDRFIVNDARDTYFCRGCGMKGGPLNFLRKIGKLACPDATEKLHRGCLNAETCPATKCRLHAHRETARPGGLSYGQRAKLRELKRETPPPAPPKAPAYTPGEASEPPRVWREHAAKLVDFAAPQLQQNPQALEFLAARGIPADFAARFRLGWLAENYYRPKKSWGLPDDGKKLWIPAGLVLPVFGADGLPLRLRVRRPNPGTLPNGEPAPRYYWVPGSGTALPVLNPAKSPLIVIVESALDALTALAQAGDFVGALPLGSCVTRPKRGEMSALESAKCLLICLDSDEAGQKQAQWWPQNFPGAARIAPLPEGMGKDFGEFVGKNGDLRGFLWDLAHEHCPVAALDVPRDLPAPQPAPQSAPPASAPAPQTEATPAVALPDLPPGVLATARSAGGTPLVIIDAGADREAIIRRYPRAAIFAQRDIQVLESMRLTPAQAEPIARVMAALSGAIEFFEPVKLKNQPKQQEKTHGKTETQTGNPLPRDAQLPDLRLPECNR